MPLVIVAQRSPVKAGGMPVDLNSYVLSPYRRNRRGEQLTAEVVDVADVVQVTRNVHAPAGVAVRHSPAL